MVNPKPHFGRGKPPIEIVEDLFGAHFVEILTAAWHDCSDDYAVESATKTFNQVLRFLRWIAADMKDRLAEADAFVSLAVAGRQRQMPEQPFLSLLAEFIRQVENASPPFQNLKTNTSRESLGSGVVAGLRRLSSIGFLPEIKATKLLKSFPRTNGYSTPSLGELNYVSPEGQSSSLDYNIITQLTSNRLRLLRLHAVETLLRELSIFEYGQKLADSPGMLAQSEQELHSLLINTGLRPNRYSSDEQVEAYKTERKRLLLSYYKNNGGFVYRRTLDILDDIIQRTFGAGWPEVRRHLEGGILAAIAAQTIVLIDTGMNVGVCDGLASNPFTGRTQRGNFSILTIAGVKNRAGGKIVEVPLIEATVPSAHPESKVSSVDALRIWQRLSEPFRTRAAGTHSHSKDFLWICPELQFEVERICKIEGPFLYEWWKKFLSMSRDDELKNLDITRRMIRTSVLQKKATRPNMSLAIAQLVAQHSSQNTTHKYVSRQWVDRKLMDMIRDFQDTFEALVSNKIADIHIHLGVTSEIIDSRILRGIETGLGFICNLDRSGRPGENYKPDCMEVDLCPTCENMYFTPTDSSLLNLYLFNFSLHYSQDEFFKSNPTRWIDVWLPNLALTEAIIQKLENSHRKRQALALRREVQISLAEGKLAYVSLW